MNNDQLLNYVFFCKLKHATLCLYCKSPEPPRRGLGAPGQLWRRRRRWVAVSIFGLRSRVGIFSACSGPSWSTMAITTQSLWSAPSYFELLAAYKPSHKASLAYKDLKPKQHKARLCKLFVSKLQVPVFALIHAGLYRSRLPNATMGSCGHSKSRHRDDDLYDSVSTSEQVWAVLHTLYNFRMAQ